MEYRIEKDTMGEIKVPKNVYWAAQTQRSYENFKIGKDKMPIEVIHALAHLKKACAKVNFNDKKLDEPIYTAIDKACDEVIKGNLDSNFPLVVYQTGSGTQSNMNVNEVIASYANELLKNKKVHPNDHVNMGQSSNDTFPTAMHISATLEIFNKLIPSIENLTKTFKNLEKEYSDIIKIGRTHLQDATPIKFSQEVSGWRNSLEINKEMILQTTTELSKLAIGGTAVGTGLNTKKTFGEEVAKILTENLNLPFQSDENKFHALTSKDALVFAHGALKATAANLLKIANDIRFLASGPRCGYGELYIPENEPGSSIMPGKVNPTQCEALTMVCIQVMGNDATIGFAASQGNFELNVYMPLIINNFLNSTRLLSDAINSFNKNCAIGIKPNKLKMEENLNNSLMLVTALNPYIGYENAAKVAKHAYKNNLSLKEAAAELNLLTKEQFEEYINPEKMV